jgi:hypothetical protein
MGAMFTVTVCCTSCGRTMLRLVDDACPPSYIGCACGARFELRVSDEILGGVIPDVADDTDWADADTGPRCLPPRMRELFAS